ncbi:hypothetical protein H0H81_000933 [Sphagnurus paluster]|uniref:Uncharacterized protein n=1 Tax=Sphagnurus paluster TaxID=117069 RepID=A0A9P7GI12_9AGAR|nr:hypothetical protein H0H81_000933 [Sphagnurus paluster]
MANQRKKERAAKKKPPKATPEPKKKKGEASKPVQVPDPPPAPRPKPRPLKKKVPEPIPEPEVPKNDHLAITPPPEIDPDDLHQQVARTLLEMRLRNIKEVHPVDDPTPGKRKRLMEDLEIDQDGEDEVQEDAGAEGFEDEDERSSIASSHDDLVEVEGEYNSTSRIQTADLVVITPEKPFPITFSVPFKGATESLKIMSNISWAEFVGNLADTMCIPPKQVSVAYRFSTDPRSAAFKHLSKPIHLIELVEAVVSAEEQLTNSKSKKVFSVELKSLEDGSVGKGKASKAKPVKKAKTWKQDSSDSSASSSDETAIDGIKIKSDSKKSLTQWVAQLEEDNACDEHGHACVKLTTGHRQLRKNDLATWAIFMQSGYTSTTSPPPKLKLSDAPLPTRSKAPTTPTQPLNSVPNPLPFGTSVAAARLAKLRLA